RDIASYQDLADALLAHLVHAGVDALLGVLGLAGLAQVVDRNVRAVLREADRDRLPDPRASAGDQDVLALDAGHRLDRYGCGSCVRHGSSRSCCCAVRPATGLLRRSSERPRAGKSSTDSSPAPTRAALSAPSRSPSSRPIA